MRFQSRKALIEFIELIRSLGYELTPSSRGYTTLLMKLPTIFKLDANIEKEGNYFIVSLLKGGKTELSIVLEKVSNVWQS